jgi:hypothetical protein
MPYLVDFLRVDEDALARLNTEEIHELSRAYRTRRVELLAIALDAARAEVAPFVENTDALEVW